MGGYIENKDGTRSTANDIVLQGVRGVMHHVCSLCEKPFADECEVILVGRKSGDVTTYNAAHIECVRGKDGT